MYVPLELTSRIRQLDNKKVKTKFPQIQMTRPTETLSTFTGLLLCLRLVDTLLVLTDASNIISSGFHQNKVTVQNLFDTP